MNEQLTLRNVNDVAKLGPEWNILFDMANDVAATRAWFAAIIAAALPTGSTPLILALSDQAGPLALLPMLDQPGRCLTSLTTPYTCLFQPLWRDGITPDALRRIGQFCRRWPLTRVEALSTDWSGLPLLRSAFTSAGLACRSFSHFGNWHEPIPTGGWDAYLAGRPGALRQTIRRRTRAALARGDRVLVARDGPALGAAIEAYEQVYRRSWKQPEPYPAFNRVLVRELAAEGTLRIGTMWRGDLPIAAQYWTVFKGIATVLKLAHDDAFRSASPGTVLTAATIRELLDVDGVKELDFGRGDDDYKRDWVGQRRVRVGLLGLDVRTVAGLRSLARHDLGVVWRRARANFA